MANDSAPYGPLSQSVAVNITILDVNDNAPSFDQSYKVVLPQNAEIGQSVVSVHATDKDSGSNGAVYYSLTSNNQTALNFANQYFQINPQTGLITVSKQLTPSLQTLILTVTATDLGTPPLSGQGKPYETCN